MKETFNIKGNEYLEGWHYIEAVAEIIMQEHKNITVLLGEEHVYIGREYVTLRDDETGGEFKANAEKTMQLIFGDDEYEFINEQVYS